jgi:hypothetical protein
MKDIMTMQEIPKDYKEQDEPYVYKLVDIGLIMMVTAAATALFTFCLTEYNIEQDCKAVSAFRIDGTGFKCEVVKHD